MSKIITVTNISQNVLSFPQANLTLSVGEQKTIDLNEIQFNSTILDILSTYVSTSKAYCYLDSVQLSADDVTSLKYRDVVSDGSIGKDTTDTDLDIYVNQITGNNYAGDGSDSKPYETITYALSKIPRKIGHKINVLLTEGTYTEFPYDITHEIHGIGQLTIQGQGDTTTVAGPFTITGTTNITAAGVPVAHDITVAGAGWTTDQFVGKFLRATSGSNSGKCYAIHSNDADRITIGESLSIPSTSETFEIVDLPVKISVNHGIDLHVENRFDIGTLYTNGVRFGVTGIYLEVTGSDNRLKISGNDNFLHTNGVKLKAAKTTVEGNVFIGGAALSFPSEIKNVDFRLPNTDYFPGTIITDTDGAPGSYKRAFDIYYGKCNLADVTVLGTIFTGYNSNMETYGVTCSGIEIYDNSSVTINNTYVGRCFSSGIYSIGGCGHFTYVYFRDTVDSAFFVRRANFDCVNIDGETANITKYGLEIDALSIIRINASALSGTLGDIRFVTGGTTVAYPAAGLSATDSAGSFVVNT